MWGLLEIVFEALRCTVLSQTKSMHDHIIMDVDERENMAS